MSEMSSLYTRNEGFQRGGCRKATFKDRSHNHFWKLNATICSPPSTLQVYAKDRASETYNKEICCRSGWGYPEQMLRVEGI